MITKPIYCLLLFFFFFTGCEKKENSSQQQQSPFTDMKAYIEQKCTMCHFSDRIFQKPQKPKEWVKIVRRMRNRNRQFITAEDEQKILDYLIANRSTPEGGEGEKVEEPDSDQE